MFTCQDCGKQFNYKGSLTSHINGAHKRIKYNCNHCEKEFSSYGARWNHVNRVH